MSMYPIEDWRFFARLLRRCNQLYDSNISVFFFLFWNLTGLIGGYMGEIVTVYFGVCSDISVCLVF
jgi:hypothetical protein